MSDDTSTGRTRSARGDRGEVLVGEDAKGLSAAALGRLKTAWAEEYKDWTQRSLEGRQYAYL
jgi:hypothetical protein